MNPSRPSRPRAAAIARPALRVNAAAALVLTLAWSCAGGAPPPLSPDWAADAVWDDGLAEVAVYEASRVIYGAPRPYRAVLITVKEDFDRATLVKADPPWTSRQVVGVLKQNAVREIPTPNYDYRMMTSTFVERADPSKLVKLTSGSHEWCGNTWKAVRVREGRAVYSWASYFDGEGDGEQDLGLKAGDLLADQLPLVLRGLRFRDGLEFRARLLPTFATTRAGPVRWTEATFRVTGPEETDLPAGARSAWRVDVSAGDARLRLWFDAAGTHPLLKMETSDGDTLALESIERRAYWKL